MEVEVVLPEELLLKALMRLHEPIGGLAALRFAKGTSRANEATCVRQAVMLPLLPLAVS